MGQTEVDRGPFFEGAEAGFAERPRFERQTRWIAASEMAEKEPQKTVRN